MTCPFLCTDTAAALDAAADCLGTDPGNLRRLLAILALDRAIETGPATAYDLMRGVTERLRRLVAGLDPDTTADRPAALLTALAIIAAMTGEADGAEAAAALNHGYLQLLIARDETVAEVYAEQVAEAFLANGRVPLPTPFLLLKHGEDGR